MKLILGLFVVAVALTARAEVKAEGTVLATACAKTFQSNTQITSVCFASVVGRTSPYLTVSNDVWSIRKGRGRIDQLDHVGTIEGGRLQNRLTTVVRKGTLERGAGDSITLKLQNQVVHASHFEIQFHTMTH